MCERHTFCNNVNALFSGGHLVNFNWDLDNIIDKIIKNRQSERCNPDLVLNS